MFTLHLLTAILTNSQLSGFALKLRLVQLNASKNQLNGMKILGNCLWLPGTMFKK